jgi:hypothetical protein
MLHAVLPRVPRPVARLGALATVVGVLTLLGGPAANAAPSVTIPLVPDDVMVVPYPVENFGPLTLASLDSDTYAPVDVQWSGTVVLQLPSTIDGSAMSVTLGLAPTDEDPPTLEYSTDNLPPDLTVTPLGGGQYSVALPADDTINGPYGYLTFDNLSSTVPGVDVMAADYLLQFGNTGPVTQNLTPDTFAVGVVSCAPSCPVPAVTAGQQFALTVPPSSLLRQLGLGSFAERYVTLEPISDPEPIVLDGSSDLSGLGAAVAAAGRPGSPRLSPLQEAKAAMADAVGIPERGAVPLPGGPHVLGAATPYAATLTVPASVKAGNYALSVVEAGASGGGSMTMLELEVKAPQPVNPGLRSDTGWVEPTASGPNGASLVALGGGLLLVAGLGTVTVLQGRRTAE